MGRAGTAGRTPRGVIDFSKAKDQDRFEVPKGCMTVSKSGTLLHGLPAKPCLRLDSAHSMLESSWTIGSGAPSGPVPDPSRVQHRAARQLQYAAAIASREVKEGLSARAERGKARCQNTQFRKHLGSSVGEHLRWGGSVAGSVEVTPRPAAASKPLHQPPGQQLTSWDMSRQACCPTRTPRFAARAAAEQQRAAAPDRDAIRNRRLTELHSARSAASAVRLVREECLANAWPHGLPKGDLSRARSEGLRVVGLGCGQPWAMPEAQYRALRPGMKM
ncbi:hypothetical protein ACKKBG_A30115 [Auxenochlorella protothecoides x Auxenochlorella symbiontica]